jgi:hypothetical protein
MLETACPKPAPREKRARKPVRRRNKKRYSANWLRAYGSPERAEFVNARPCVGCLTDERLRENHHIKTGGKGRKADAKFIVALCAACHDDLHQHGRQSLEERYAIDLEVEAAATEARWLAFQRSDAGGER